MSLPQELKEMSDRGSINMLLLTGLKCAGSSPNMREGVSEPGAVDGINTQLG